MLVSLWPLPFALLAAVPAPVKRIYLAPDDHTDYLWTADEATYRRVFCATLDYYLDQIDQNAGEPDDWQARWNCDGTLWLWEYQRNRPPEAFERLLQRIRDGHISCPVSPLVQTYGGQPTEAILRGMAYAGQLERRHGLPFELGSAMENQTMPLGLGLLWAGAGVRYCWHGICACASRLHLPGDREHEVYWWTGPDGSRVLTKWYSLLRNNQSVGGYAEARHPADVVALLDTDPEFQRRHPYPVSGAFGVGWDDLQTTSDRLVAAARQLSTPERRVIVSNEVDYFEDLAAHHGDAVPALSCSFGNEWDLLCCSLMEVTSRVRRAVECLRGAEALATVVSLHDPTFWSSRAAARDEAHLALGLYWEHDWTADGPVARPIREAWQRRLAATVEGYAQELETAATTALGTRIQRTGAASRYALFNPLSWARTATVDLPLDDPAQGCPFDLASGRPLPAQRLTIDGRPVLRVLAAAVPPLGYRVVELRTGELPPPEQPVSVAGAVLTNRFWRLTLDPSGAIISLLDRTAGDRELVQTIDGRRLNDLGGTGGTLAVEHAGPLSATLVATSDDPVRHTTRVTLTADSPWVRLENRIEASFDQVLTWGFGFAAAGFSIRHEELGAILSAALTTSGGHYAPRQGRYDWLTLNHFVDLGDQDWGVTLSNADLAFFKPGRSRLDQLDGATPLLTILAGGQVDGPRLGFPNQGGDTAFRQRFALTRRGAWRPDEALRFSLAHQNPLLVVPVTGGGELPATTWSLGAPSDPRALLWALKPAEDPGAGTILRWWNPTAATVDLSFRPAWPVARAHRTTLIETDRDPLAVAAGGVSDRLGPHAWSTWRLTR